MSIELTASALTVVMEAGWSSSSVSVDTDGTTALDLVSSYASGYFDTYHTHYMLISYRIASAAGVVKRSGTWTVNLINATSGNSRAYNGGAAEVHTQANYTHNPADVFDTTLRPAGENLFAEPVPTYTSVSFGANFLHGVGTGDNHTLTDTAQTLVSFSAAVNQTNLTSHFVDGDVMTLFANGHGSQTTIADIHTLYYWGTASRTQAWGQPQATLALVFPGDESAPDPVGCSCDRWTRRIVSSANAWGARAACSGASWRRRSCEPVTGDIVWDWSTTTGMDFSYTTGAADFSSTTLDT